MSKPTIVIMAGGSNSRFFPFNTGTHKGALTLMGETIIGRTIRNLESHGFDDIVIVVSPRDYDGQGLSDQLNPADFAAHISFVLQPEAKGMGNALLASQSKLADRFAVIFPGFMTAGETLTNMMQLSDTNAICVTETSEPWLYGIVTLAGNRAVSIVEKPAQGTEPSNLKVEGLYLLTSEFVDILTQLPEAEYNFETALNQLMQREPIFTLQLDRSLPSLKYPWHLFSLQRYLFDYLPNHRAASATVAPTAVIDHSQGPVYIADGVRVGHAAKIVGPCYLGTGCLVGDFSFVRHSSLEMGVEVGANTEVARSIIMRDSTLHFGYLADSIIGQEVRIGAGLITANKRFDRRDIKVYIKNQPVGAGRENLGVMIGDRANVGIRVSTMPGVCIGSDTQIFPGQVLYQNVPHQQVVKPNQ